MTRSFGKLAGLIIPPPNTSVKRMPPIPLLYGPLPPRFRLFCARLVRPHIALFVVGLIAYRRNWLLGLPDKIGGLWLRIAAVLILLWPPMMVSVGALTDDTPLKGGWHWQSLAYSLWESFFCISMCIGVTYAFRRYLNQRGQISRFLVPNAYAAYLIHAPVITTLAFAARDATLYPLLKWAVLALAAVPLCFWLSSLIHKLPYTERVLQATALFQACCSMT